MRESKFVEQNHEKWEQFENNLKDKKKDPHQLRAQLIEITDDLSFSRTFYKNRSVRIYLNGLAQEVYLNIYRNKKNFFHSLTEFYTGEIPRILYNCRRELLVSFLVLLLSVAIGIFSSMKDQQFASSILGDDYVNRTLENIKKGDPMGIYKQHDQVSMFFQIAINNLRVSLMIFIFGLLASYGSLVLMVRNGIMLGVFIYFFYSRNLATEFNLTVWMHGTIEILTLVIETVAGMLLGRGLVYPGTLSRVKAFSIWGRRGAMLFLSTVPFIIFAAFIESFLTRYTDMPNILRLLLILLSLFIMVFYFVIYPYRKFRNVPDTELGMPELREENEPEVRKNTIYSNGQIFLKTIQLFSGNFSRILKTTCLVSLFYLGLMFFLYKEETIGEFALIDIDFGEFILDVLTTDTVKFGRMYGNLSLLFNSDESYIMYILSSVWICFVAYAAMLIFSKHTGVNTIRKHKLFICAFVFSFIINLFMLSDNGLTVLCGIVLSSLAIVLMANSAFKINEKDLPYSIADYFRSGFARMNGIMLLFMLILFFGLIFIISPFTYLSIWLMEMNVEMSEDNYNFILRLVMMFSFIMLMSFLLIFYFVQCFYLAFTVHEINDAQGLNIEIDAIGTTKKTYGIETE